MRVSSHLRLLLALLVAMATGAVLAPWWEGNSPYRRVGKSLSLQGIVGDGWPLLVCAGGTLLMLLLMWAVQRVWVRRGQQEPSLRDALFLGVWSIAAVAVGRLAVSLAPLVVGQIPGATQITLLAIVPAAAGALVVRLVLRLEVALLFAVVGSLIFGLMAGSVEMGAYALVGSMAGAVALRSVTARGDLLRVGVQVGLAQAVAMVALLLFQAEQGVAAYGVNVLAAFVSGILTSFVALALTPAVEAAFGYTTDLKLLELANLNHPALKELIVQAPGTYHHSVIVGALVEAAAESVGANPLLAKVMAYYHDLGKGCNAIYFIENQRGANPHDRLKASMSAMIIKRHVTDGLKLADQHRLGDLIKAGIAEHHGTTLIQFFFHKAKEAEDGDDPAEEGDYRYPGRKPQSRETAIVMLGDSVEASARALANPTPARLQGLVNKIINAKFTDGQLEECDLTLHDLHLIAKAFMSVLTSIYHERIEYPEHVDSDPQSARESAPDSDESQAHRPNNIRRLGLSGR